MENKKKDRYDDQMPGYPAGFYRMGCNLPCKDRKVRYDDMDGCKMRGGRRYGPEGYWGI